MSKDVWRFSDLITESLRTDAYIILNKRAIHVFGLHQAILLGEMISKFVYFRDRGMLDHEGWFYCLQEQILEDTGLPFYSQRKAITSLVDQGVIRCRRKGVPPKLWFFLNFKELYSQIFGIEELNIRVRRIDNKNKIRSNNDFPSGNQIGNFPTENSDSQEFSIPGTLQENELQKSSRTKFPPRSAAQPKPESPPKESHPLVAFWNSLPSVPKHKNPNSQTYQSAVRMISRLKRGNLDQCGISNAWLEKWKIPRTWLGRKFQDETIREIFTELAKLYQDGYWPPNKSKLPKNLADLIFNPRSKSSWFLAARAIPIQPIVSSKTQELDDSTQRILSLLLRIFPDSGESERKILIEAAKGVQHFHSKLPDDQYGELERVFPYPEILARHYMVFLKDQGKDISPSQVRIDSYYWKHFLLHESHRIGISLTTGESVN